MRGASSLRRENLIRVPSSCIIWRILLHQLLWHCTILILKWRIELVMLLDLMGIILLLLLQPVLRLGLGLRWLVGNSRDRNMLRMELLSPYLVMLMTYLISLVILCLYLKVWRQRRIGCNHRLSLLRSLLMNNARFICIKIIRVWWLLKYHIRLLIHYIWLELDICYLWMSWLGRDTLQIRVLCNRPFKSLAMVSSTQIENSFIIFQRNLWWLNV